MQLLLIDNYDSFTYNLLHLVREVCESADRIVVVPNDRISAMEVGDYDRILLSPGPGVPSEAGALLDVVRTAAGRIPILGVCLGHQAIAEAFGAELCNLEHPLHGVRSRVRLDTSSRIFRGLPPTVAVGRYHSWMVDGETLPPDLKATAWDDEGRVMAIEHVRYAVYGMQFHPESYMTECGGGIIRNFLNSDVCEPKK